MLGHKAMQLLSKRYDVVGSVRHNPIYYCDHPVLKEFNLVGNVDATDFSTIEYIVQTLRPDIIINCIGIVKQLQEANDPVLSIRLNALFPHLLAQLCVRKGIRMIHMSTDCVFSGKKGDYTEDDIPDASDLYGRTKLLGEVNYPGCLTVRTSIIGRELNTSHGLLEWFFSHQGEKVKGYRKAIFSGLTTNAFSNIIGDLIEYHPNICGTWHVAAHPISKYDLLVQIRDRFHLNIEVEPDDSVIVDRSLNPSKFLKHTGIMIPTWRSMIDQLYHDKTPYTIKEIHNVYK